jgi:hypothetical protein
MAAPRDEAMTGQVVQVPVTIGPFTASTEWDATELKEPDWKSSVLEDHWGLHYILFPHEVVLHFDLRNTEVEQLCTRAVKKFPPRKNFTLAPTSKRPVSSGQTVPDLGWREGFRGIPKWTGPVNAPRLILDPRVTGIVHVIFDLTQPKLEQWESAKQWLRKMQVETVGKVKARRASPTGPATWVKYLRILDACDFNPDPQDPALIEMTYKKIGQTILGITKNTEENKARARAKQDHLQAQRLLAHFPY